MKKVFKFLIEFDKSYPILYAVLIGVLSALIIQPFNSALANFVAQVLFIISYWVLLHPAMLNFVKR